MKRHIFGGITHLPDASQQVINKNLLANALYLRPDDALRVVLPAAVTCIAVG